MQPGLFNLIFGSSVMFCRIIAFIASVFGILSSWLIVLISIERFMAIRYPLKVHIYFSMKRTYIALSILKVLICMNSFYYIFAFSVFDADDRPICHLHGLDEKVAFTITIIISLLYSFIPFGIMTILNTLTVMKLKSRQEFHARLQHNRQSTASRDRSMVAMMLSVCVLFALTTFPIIAVSVVTTHVVTYIKGVGIMGNSFNEWSFVIAVVLSNINNSMNFFLYCMTGSVFRNALFSLLKCKKMQYQGDPSHQVAALSGSKL